ncbi:hypothetical protein SAMN05444285_12382 [Draconibacterium orientale]|uniref:Uncharacterized protein n=1 Tax=Draconibacterium orientale TaxID=1168034 RepID=X5DHS1_9BACT|nr:hypothetical protein [Draconibacterium orientale]AHW60639.1 hypothetical protein FH5T_16065 [Draconibacterium orientale]SET79416.1 hypothetical protein SAMN05444285_12382 [Draconibacterium orientale]
MKDSNYRTAEIFDILSKGQFICSNAINSQRRYLYQYIEENINELEPKFIDIGYQLENGNNYYYFSRPNESTQNVENKIEKGLRWLDILAFFTTFRKDLCRGARFKLFDILQQIDINMSLKEQLTDLQKRTNPGRNYQEMLNDLIREVQKEGFIDLENEMDQTWKILDSWDYMEKLVMAVNIQDEEINNQPQELN